MALGLGTAPSKSFNQAKSSALPIELWEHISSYIMGGFFFCKKLLNILSNKK